MTKLIHILNTDADGGFVMCDRTGSPDSWESNETWTTLEHPHLATCSKCIEAAGFTVAELRKSKRRKGKR